MKIHVGTNQFPKEKHSIYKHYEIAEISTFYSNKPKRKTLLNWRENAPKKFRFVIPAPFALTQPEWQPTKSTFWRKGAGGFIESDEQLNIWNHIDDSAGALKSNTILFTTPPAFTPTFQNKENFKRFFKKINRKQYRFVWEPQGLWSQKDIFPLAEELELIVAHDPFNSDLPIFETSFRLFKIRNFMRNSFDEQDFEQILQNAEGAKRIFIIVATPKPSYIAKKIISFLNPPK